MDPVLANFKPVGWDGCVIVASGLALKYLAWYQVAPTTAPWKERPTLQEVVASLELGRTRVGTMPKSHVARIGLEPLGTSEPPKVTAPSSEHLVWVTAQHQRRKLPEPLVEPRKSGRNEVAARRFEGLAVPVAVVALRAPWGNPPPPRHYFFAPPASDWVVCGIQIVDVERPMPLIWTIVSPFASAAWCILPGRK